MRSALACQPVFWPASASGLRKSYSMKFIFVKSSNKISISVSSG